MKKRSDFEAILIILLILFAVITIHTGDHEGKMRHMKKYYPERYQTLYGDPINDTNISIERQYPLYPSGIYMVSGGRVLRRTQRGWAAANPVPLPDADYQQNKG